jgi:peroxiredoxin
MKFKILIALIVFIFTNAQVFAQVKPSKVLKEMYNRISEVRNGSYTVDYQYSLGTRSPVNISAKCTFENVTVKQDSVYTKYSYMSAGSYDYKHNIEGFYTVYNGEYRIVLGKDSIATVINSKNHPAWGIYMQGDQKSNLLYNYFFNPKKRNEEFDNSYKLTLLPSEKIGNDSCLVVEAYKDSYGRATNYRKKIFIRVLDYIPIQVIEEMDWNESHQFSKIRISELVLNDKNFSIQYNIDSIPSYFKILSFENVSAKKLLALDTISAYWKIKTLDGSSIESNKLNSKATLITFWYSDCEPCNKSLTSIQKIHDEFREKGLKVIGFNPFDEDTEKLKTFLSDKGLSFPVSKNNRNECDIFNVDSYPTFYLLNKSGRIIYTEEGFNNKIESALREKIQDVLK